jgi:hypothetical protein
MIHRLVLLLPLFVACSSAPPAPAPPAADAPRPMRSIAGQLAHEREHRPAAKLRSEAVLAALAEAGVPVAEPRQYLGLTAAAAYCEGGHTPAGVAVAVCEYPDEAAAARGKAHVEQRYAALATQRTILVRGTTSLTVTAAAGALNTEDGRKAAASIKPLN